MARRPKNPKDGSTDTYKDFVGSWSESIKAALKYREKYGQSKKWKEYRRYYRGDWDQSIVPVNMIFSYGRALIPRVYFSAPRVVVTALHPDYVHHATVVEAIDNLLINQSHVKQSIKTSALDAYLCGTGPIKLGYDSEFGYSSDYAIGPSGESATQEGKNEPRRIEYKSYIKPGFPWALRCSPDDIVVPFGYKYGSDLPWIAHRILRPLDDIKNDQKYQNTQVLKGTVFAELDSIGQQRGKFRQETLINFGELWEIRDMRDGMIHVICEDQLLMSVHDELQVGSALPYEFIIFNEDPEYFWGIPDVRQILPQQLELNMARTQAQRHRAIALLKFLALRGAIKSEDVTKFLSGEVGPFIEIDGESLAAAVTMLQPHVPPDLIQAVLECKNDIREVLGFDYNQAAMLKPGTPPSATESNIVSQSFNLRADERKDVVADVLQNIVSKWNDMIFKFWDETRVVQVVGPEGAPIWVSFKGQDVAGEYRLRIDPESGFPISHALKMQFADKALGQFGGDEMLNQQELKRIVLSQYEWVLPGISRILNDLQPAELAQGIAAARQPAPQGTGRFPAQGNRGGGNAGSSPENPIDFSKYAKGGK